MVTNVTFWSESLAFPLLSTLVLVPLVAMARGSVDACFHRHRHRLRLRRNAAQFIFELLFVVRV